MQNEESWKNYKESWEEYKDVINHLAHITIRKWMIGVDLDDIKQSLWAEFFRICDTELCDEEPGLNKQVMTERLRTFASSLKREEGDYKFKSKKLVQTELEHLSEGIEQKHWRKVRNLWEEYLTRIPTRDAVILRYAAQGATNKTIALALNLSTKRIESIRSRLIKAFKEEVDNNVQTH